MVTYANTFFLSSTKFIVEDRHSACKLYEGVRGRVIRSRHPPNSLLQEYKALLSLVMTMTKTLGLVQYITPLMRVSTVKSKGGRGQI